jgi:transcription factor C subunit 3
MTLLETMAKAGEPTSAPPGTRTDKRTLMAALDSLENRGKIKLLKTSVQTHTGVHRPARIAYLPHVTEEQLKDYLAELAKTLQPVPQTASFVKIDEKVEYGADPTTVSRSVLPLQLLQLEQPGVEKDKKERWSKNLARANQLFTYDDETIREVLLAERTTLGQSYGFMVGKMARVTELHLLILKAFQSDQLPAHLVSREEQIFDLSFLCNDIPLIQYCSFISCLAHSKELMEFFTGEAGRQTPVRDLPLQLHSFLQIGRSRARSRFLEMLEVMRQLGIAIPLQPSDSENPWITCSGGGKGPFKFDRASLDGWTTNTPMIAPSFWRLNGTAPIHLWRDSEASPPFWKSVPIGTAAHAIQYWDTLKIASLETSIRPDDTPSSGSHSALSVNISLARSLRRPNSWNTRYILTWHQMQYLKQFIDIHSTETPLEEHDDTKREEIMSKVCRVTSATRDAVAGFFRETRQRLLRELNRIKQKGDHTAGGEKRARRAAEVKELLAKKAAEERRRREQKWNALLLRVHPGQLSSTAASRVKRIQKRFLEAGSTNETEKWERDILDAIHEADIATVLKISKSIVAAPAVSPPLPLPIVSNPLEPSVEDLIQRQRAFLPSKDPKKIKRRGKSKATGQAFQVRSL